MAYVHHEQTIRRRIHVIAGCIRSRRASVSLVAAFVVPVLLGMTALVADFGHGLVIKTENQRVADLAAYAGALAYAASGSTTTMAAAAQNVATLNGITASVSASLVTSPRNASSKAVSVTVTATDSLLLAPVLGMSSSAVVSSTAYAQLATQVPVCLLAFNTAGTGVTLSGGAAITAPACTVASNSTISVPCGTSLTAKAVNYNSTAVPSQPCSGIQSSTLTNAVTADPLANNTAVSGAVARLSTVAAMTSPSAPSVTTGGDISFGYTQSSTIAQALADGCGASFSGSTWTLTCAQGTKSTYNFGNISLAGGISVNFNTSGVATTTYNFSGAITNAGSTLKFGPGIYNIAQGVTTSGGTTTSFGAGAFTIGASTSACGGGGKYSICHAGSTLTFGGPSNFTLAAGVYNSGGSTLSLGSGSTNSFQIGSSSDGNAIYVGGGSTTTLADATGTSSVFQLIGNLNVTSGGGSCLTVSAAAQHDIKGAISTAGGTLLGAGVYTVNGYLAFGANGGGDVTCNGATVGVTGTGVTFVTDGTTTSGASSCYNAGFCVASGYSNVSLTAPTTGATAYLLVVGPTSSRSAAGAIFADGASNTSLSGVFYFPYGTVAMSGGATIGSGSGQCLELIGSQITLSGGTAATSSCISGGNGGSAVTALVQ